jgi:polyisoprenoid-binding protein YceI
MRFTKFAVVYALSFAAATGFAQPEKYEIDPGHSRIGFTVRHMVVTKVSGSFDEFSGTILYDEKDITKSSVTVTIKAASIDTDNERRDNDLRSANFFDVENYPEITFVSKKIEKQGEGYVAIGDFTMHGVTKEVALPFTILGKVKDQRGNTKLGIESGMKLNRFDYEVKSDRTLDDGSLVVSKEVEVNLTLAAVARKQQ